jgi:DNA-binding LacI/PurR family transcriptional regulator
MRTIAIELGLSLSTVSKALSGKSEVSGATRERVVAFAKEKGYFPEHRRLPYGRRVAVVIQDADYEDFGTAFFFGILSGFKQYAKTQGFEVVILSISAAEQNECKYDEYIKDKQLDGVFVMGLKTTDPYYRQLSHTLVNSVALDIVTENPLTGSVVVNNLAGARLAISHLTKLNHEAIGFINGHCEAYVSKERLAGYIAAMCENGLAYNPLHVYTGDFSEESGSKGAEYLAKRGVTAIFCASDLMALGAVRKLASIGLSVPGSISVIGFDNAPFSQVCSPPLTTVAQDWQRIGTTACALLDGLMRGIPVNQVILTPKLIVRESTKSL